MTHPAPARRRAPLAVGVAALAVGVLGGAVVTVVGVLIGGRTLERTAPDLLQRIKAFPVG